MNISFSLKKNKPSKIQLLKCFALCVAFCFILSGSSCRNIPTLPPQVYHKEFQKNLAIEAASALYPRWLPSRTVFSINPDQVTDIFGRKFISLLREQGYKVVENYNRGLLGPIPLSWSYTNLDGPFIDVTLTVGSVILTCSFSGNPFSGTVLPVGVCWNSNQGNNPFQ